MISHVLVCLLSHEEKGSISNTLQRGSAAVWEQAWARGFLRGAWLRLSSELTACRRVSIRHPHFADEKRNPVINGFQLELHRVCNFKAGRGCIFGQGVDVLLVAIRQLDKFIRNGNTMRFVVGCPSVDDLIIRITDRQSGTRQQIAAMSVLSISSTGASCMMTVASSSFTQSSPDSHRRYCFVRYLPAPA